MPMNYFINYLFAVAQYIRSHCEVERFFMFIALQRMEAFCKKVLPSLRFGL